RWLASGLVATISILPGLGWRWKCRAASLSAFCGSRGSSVMPSPREYAEIRATKHEKREGLQPYLFALPERFYAARPGARLLSRPPGLSASARTRKDESFMGGANRYPCA